MMNYYVEFDPFTHVPRAGKTVLMTALLINARVKPSAVSRKKRPMVRTVSAEPADSKNTKVVLK